MINIINIANTNIFLIMDKMISIIGPNILLPCSIKNILNHCMPTTIPDDSMKFGKLLEKALLRLSDLVSIGSLALCWSYSKNHLNEVAVQKTNCILNFKLMDYENTYMLIKVSKSIKIGLFFLKLI